MNHITPFSQKSIRAVLAASFAMISFSALATVQFDIGTGNGFIGRGDVISHPTLGKNALSVNPEITFSANGAHYEQICYKIQGNNQQIKTFRRGDVHVNFTTTTRQAPGNDNISGYLLNGIGNDNGTPTNICPVAWYPYNGSYPVLIYGPNLPPLLYFRADVLQGGWVFDTNLQVWTVWNP